MKREAWGLFTSELLCLFGKISYPVKRGFCFVCLFLNVLSEIFQHFAFGSKAKETNLNQLNFKKFLDSQTTEHIRMQLQKRFNFQCGGKMSPLFVLVFVLTQHSRGHLNSYEADQNIVILIPGNIILIKIIDSLFPWFINASKELRHYWLWTLFSCDDITIM